MIWFVSAILTAGVIFALTRSLYRASTPEAAPDSEINVYRLQLSELDRDEERATLSKEEADQTRAEIARRLLRASRGTETPSERGSHTPVSANAALAVLALVISIGAFGLYIAFGSSALPDQPLEARLDAPPEKQSLGIQIAKVERRLRENPRDGPGWTIIAPAYLKLGQFEKAAEAFRKAILLDGEDEDKLLGLSEALTLANDGVMTEQVKLALEAILARNPKSLRGRVWLAMLAQQEERKADAERIYREILAEDLPEHVKAVLNDRLASLNAEATDNSTPEKQQADAGFQGRQGVMIRGMVERLAERLKHDKEDLNGWMMLIRSYFVLKETGKAEEAANSAREQFAADAQALEHIETLTRSLGLVSGKEHPSTPEKQQADAGFQGRQGVMIRGMVERLAERLKQDKADLDGWLKLIRSYAVLKETGKAEEAANSAREQFAADAQALEHIETLTRSLGLASGKEQPRSQTHK